MPHNVLTLLNIEHFFELSIAKAMIDLECSLNFTFVQRSRTSLLNRKKCVYSWLLHVVLKKKKKKKKKNPATTKQLEITR